MFTTILVPLDGSPFAEGALPLAAALAARGGAQIILLRAAEQSVPPAPTPEPNPAGGDVVAVALTREELALVARALRDLQGDAPQHGEMVSRRADALARKLLAAT
jgi:nucleotide-binding universal stress UspA family protein